MESRWTGKSLRQAAVSLAGAALLAAGVLGTAFSAPQSNIAVTPHNLSRNGLPNSLTNVRADANGTSAICAFCHTPHGANTAVKGPLWNRSTSNSTYIRYTSSSLDANTVASGFSDQPGGSSVLCLSCHDGMVALGNVNVLNGKANVSMNMQNSDGGKMPAGASGALTGYTRLLGTDLSNDHPISVTYNDDLAVQDGEMTRLTTGNPAQRDTITGNIIGIRSSVNKPLLPLEPTGANNSGQVQCGTCHDPHLAAEKFLRLNRFQTAAPTGGNFNENTDQICLACHPKLNRTWSESAHANPMVADESYLPAAATQRGFASGTAVWQAACLNCHDTHTVQGSRRLLREGVNTSTSGTGAGSFRVGTDIGPPENSSAIENTCYQCHDLSTSSTRVIGTASGNVPDIRTEFNRTYRMPITTADQYKAKKEIHNITNADFIETQENLGRGNFDNRHVECTDCHNPHRVRRSSTFFGTSASFGEGAKRTHNAGGTNALKGADGNVASGVLRGIWGVEPVFGAISATWPQFPIGFEVKKGDPGINTSTDRNKNYLTREYQLCFKCHSNYSNGETAADFPALGNTLGGTYGSSSARAGFSRYTNVAAEFGSVNATDPASSGRDQGETGESSVAAIEDGTAINPSVTNHRSWHPVMWPTGRTRDERRIGNTTGMNFRAPFNTNIGTQTMHCSDCHGHSQSWTQDVGPNTNFVQGPHGSDKRFLLKGDWDGTQTIGSPGFCGNCHNPTVSGSGGSMDASPDSPTGFNNAGTNGGGGHGNMHSGKLCSRCHIMLPHGWKNKAFLANLNCVGKEAGQATDCVNVSGRVVTMLPFYMNTHLRILTWQPSGNWVESSCGSGAADKGVGKDWMTDGNTC